MRYASAAIVVKIPSLAKRKPKAKGSKKKVKMNVTQRNLTPEETEGEPIEID